MTRTKNKKNKKRNTMVIMSKMAMTRTKNKKNKKRNTMVIMSRKS